ncbi:hypothetical protein MHLP_03405 [Candidatus Mycoplasma haematolamae str. Purdue]|uniref:Uncharacterized protein n=1 Tax=Mycoplasma haematolamae (strain Purdue) TaxID=1212765 RepID=I7CG80_MYCHA|nr:hypothetical protein [Candidatus Mycoplasma haematolamae]AFO52261.1 hypothetical protein MHLP_03405 [Candidatus Mycoplasma haematolamae str. Purdue]
MLAFKEDLFTSLTNWELRDLFGSNSPSKEASSLDLDSPDRKGIDSPSTESIYSPTLNLHSDGSLLLGNLGGTGRFTSSLYQFREEQAREIDVLAQLQFHNSGAQTIIKELTTEDRRYFFDALKKIESYAKGSNNERELTQQERRAVEKYFDVVSRLKEKGVDLTNQLFIRKGKDTASRFSDSSKFKKRSDVKEWLKKIKWDNPSLQVLGSSDKFVDSSEKWSGTYDHWADWWKTTHIGNSSNWGFNEGWAKNPWREFFVSEDEWKAFWKERFELKSKYYQEWKNQRQWWEWDAGKFCTVNGVEFFEGCYPTTQKKLVPVIDRANANISLQTGMRILLWMGYPLEGDRPKSAAEGKPVVKVS